MNTYDKNNLRQVILDSPTQFSTGFKLAKNTTVDNDFDKIVLSGMGGSAIPGDILKVYISDLLTKKDNYAKIKIYQNRFYKLPTEAYDNCLNIVCSYSGNTEETVASLEEAIGNKLPTIGISSGGDVERICLTNNIPHIKLPIPSKNFQPRMATGYFTSSIIQILINTGKIPDTKAEIENSITQLKEFIIDSEEIGKTLAKRLLNKTPIIYSSNNLKALALIWKIKFNENSKIPAFWNYFPEVNHNEFIGFENRKEDYSIIMLKDNLDDHRNLKRYTVSKNIFLEKNIPVHTINIPEGEMIFRLFSSLALGDWTSYHLALEYKTDPTPVPIIEYFKDQLKK